MEACGILREAQSPEAIERALELLDVAAISALNEASAIALQEACAAAAANEATCNAKLRRKLKRVTESIAQRDTLAAHVKEKEQAEQAALHAPPHQQYQQRPQQQQQQQQQRVQQQQHAPAREPKPVLETTPVDMAGATALLLATTSYYEVENALNRLQLPPKDALGQHAAEFLAGRKPLLAALQAAEVALTAAGASRMQKRRLQRLQFTIAEEGERPKKEKKEGNVAAVPAAPAGPKAADAQAVERLTAAAAALQAPAESAAALDVALSALQESLPCVFGVEEEPVRTQLAEALVVAAESGETAGGRLALAAREKRRCKRVAAALKECVAPAPATAAAPETEAVTESKQAASLGDAVAAISAAVVAEDGAALLAALTAMPAASEVDAKSEEGAALRAALGAASALSVTAPVKRRLGRAVAALEAQRNPNPVPKGEPKVAAMTAVAAAPAAPKTTLTYNPPAGAPLEPAIEAVRSATTAVALEEALKGVSSSSGTMRSRRTLRRALAAAIKEGTTLAAELNSKQRRGVARVLVALEGKAGTGAKEVALPEPEAGNKRGLAGGGEDEDGEKRTKKVHGPYVLFVGQLSYDTTAEQLEEHIRLHGITGDGGGNGAEAAEAGGSQPPLPAVQVRLLTESTGQSRGSAFVEVRSAEQLHRALSLHHTMFRGRRINVEKSCGGRNKDARAARLQQQRDEQQAAVRTKMEEVLADYESRGLPPKERLGGLLLHRLQGMTVAGMTDVLEQFLRQDVKTSSTLDRLLNEADSKAGRVHTRKRDLSGRAAAAGGGEGQDGDAAMVAVYSEPDGQAEM